MQKVLTAEEMREVDRLTTEKYGIPPLLLMENAAHAAARVIAERLGGSVEDRSILVLCGKGNNGGDGAALARVLWTQGADVEVCLFGLVEDTKDEARANFEILQRIVDKEDFEIEQPDLAFEEITGLEEWLDYDSVNFHCDDPEVIVDALFGTGLTRPLEGVFEQAAAYIAAFAGEESETLVVALDVPSGLNADSSELLGVNAKAHLTVTFTAPKLANVLPPASNCGGEIRVEHIGSPCDLVNACGSQTFVSELEDVRRWMEHTHFLPDSYKNKRGHALIIAGSDKYSGAAVLSGNAAIRSGAGIVTLAVPKSAHNIIASRVSPEVIVHGIEATDDGTIAAEAFEEIAELWKKADTVAIGPGISSGSKSTGKFVRKVIEDRITPVVIDADGLNALAPFDLQESVDLPLILTPHEGEFLRLLGTDDRDSIKDRVGAAREFAEKHNVILVLKGERTLIAEPGGTVVVNPTGNSGLGKAGNGDTLTGIISGFAAQAVKAKVDIFETVVTAVYIAGLAGDLAEARFGKRVMTASDVGECLTEAFAAAAGVRV